MSSVPKVRKRTLLLLSTLVLFLSVWAGVSLVRKQQELHKKAQAQEVIQITYQKSSEDFASPERGFMKSSQVWPDKTGGFSGIRRERPEDTVVWIYFRIDNYRNRAFDAAALNRISAAFDAVRNANLKAVITFTYNFSSGGSDAPLSRVLEHISQLTPIFQQHGDVLLTLMHGFVGAWGEWHSSTNNLTAPENQKAILDALLIALPKERMFQLRYPRDKKTHYGDPLTVTEAFSGTDKARVGHSNLCFLAGTTDGGTYRSTPRGGSSQGTIQFWKDFIAQEGRFTPIGGETCQIGSSSTRTSCSNALKELEMLRWSFLNNAFYKPILDGWVSGGCMPEIRRRLGYRFVLSKLNVSRQVAPGGKMTFRLELRNEGFASPYNLRPAILVLKEKKTGNQREIPLTSIDPRRWLPGQAINVDIQVPIPANLPQGSYNVYLWFPDASQSLRTRPDYAIRLANKGVWQPATGFNLLFDNLIVSGSPVSPPPSPPPTMTPTPPPTLPGDIDKDGDVDIFDYNLMIENFGNTNCGNVADVDGNCKVDIFDYNILIENFGKKG